jgi:hypothetical protein
MICSSLNLDRFIVRLPYLDGLYIKLEQFQGLRSELTPPHRTPQHRLAGHVDAVKLKDGLRQIDPDGGDRTVCCMLIHGRRSLDDPFRQRPSWHIRRRVGAVHPITGIPAVR